MKCNIVKLIYLLLFGVSGAARDGSESKVNLLQFKELRGVACGVLAAWAVTAASPVIAANQVKSAHSTQLHDQHLFIFHT